LEKWLNEFAKGQGIQPPNVNKEALENIPNELRKEDIKGQGEELRKSVEEKMKSTRGEIHKGKREIERYQLPTVSPQLSEDMFKLKEENFRLNLGSDPRKDPRFINRANKAQEWYEKQPNPFIRLRDDTINLGPKLVRLLKEAGEEAVNAYNDANQANVHFRFRSLNKP
jgi:hypothetical protein